MNKPKSLLDLYKLLWEQIKDKEIMGLLTQTSNLMFNSVISFNEKEDLDTSILANKKPLERNKDLVQRMIKELENDI